MADVADSVKASAKTGAFINSARRAIWVKAWEGNLASKAELCSLPFEGSLLFGPGLDKVLSRSLEREDISSQTDWNGTGNVFEASRDKINKNLRKNPTGSGGTVEVDKKVIFSFPLQAKAPKDAKIKVGGRLSFHFPVGGNVRLYIYQTDQRSLPPRILIRALPMITLTHSPKDALKRKALLEVIQELVEQQVVVPVPKIQLYQSFYSHILWYPSLQGSTTLS